MERRGLVRTPFPLCWLHQLLLSPTAEVSCCGASSQPHGNPTPALLPRGAPQHSEPPPSTGISLQPPSPHPVSPEPPWCSPRWVRCPQLSALPWPPPPPLEVLYPLLDPPVRPLPASCLVSRPFVPHQGLSRERPLSCREVLTAAPALALLCLSLGGHLLSWEGGKKLVTLARSCHVPCSFLWWLVGTGRWHRGWGLAPGAAPRAGDVPQVLLKVCRAGDVKFQESRGMSELPGG